MNESRKNFEESVNNLCTSLSGTYPDDLEMAVKLIVKCFKRKGKVLIFGNGGSASDAQHIAGELVGRFKLDRRAFSAIALTTDTSVITAIGNDYSFDCIFSRQIDGLGNPGDIAWGISTSGNSKNVITALEVAKHKRMITIGMTGNNGGRMADLGLDLLLSVPSTDTPRIQEAHLIGYHIICKMVEERFAGK